MAGSRNTPHILTVEVEEYYQDPAFRAVVPPGEWSALPTRVEWAVDRLLEVLGRYDTVATFFVDDWVARREPDLVARIHAAGHEVGSRGRAAVRPNGERVLNHVTVAAVEAKELLEELAGSTIWGHRAAQPVGASARGELCERLCQRGFRYDSSLFARELQNSSSPPRGPRLSSEGVEEDFLELPRAETSVLGVALGPLGGANFRQLPYALTRRSLAGHAEQHEPVVFGLRSWEVDRFHPELPGPAWPRFRHYVGLDRTEPRLERLLAEFRFTSARDYLGFEDTDRRGSDEAGRRGGAVG